MLTKADDYPIHQTPEPIAYSGTDRNFYDRYFFNGYAREGDLFFAAALGVYPHLNVMDASFCVITGNKQYNVHASKALHMERLDTAVGPIEIEVIEPLNILRVTCNDEANGITADVCFNARTPVLEEPRFIHRLGSQTLMDSTRLTQNGGYSGWLTVNDETFELDPQSHWGTRDRSWGIRSVGMRDPQQNPDAGTPQFFWLWAPINFSDGATFYHLNADAQGEPWNTSGNWASSDEIEHMPTAASQLQYQPGTRIAAHAEIFLTSKSAETMQLDMTPQQTFYMKGLGYGHPEWGHGLYHGELDTGFEIYDLDTISDADPGNFHVQAICDVTLTGPEGRTQVGKGVLEQLVFGPFAPYGFKDLVDLTP